MTGKVVAEGEQRGAHACFDVFVKDSTGKCAITVAVCGDLRDVQTSEIIEKEVEFKGMVKDNGKCDVRLLYISSCVLGYGELEFVVSGWQDLIPRSVLNEVNFDVICQFRFVYYRSKCRSRRRLWLSTRTSTS